MKNHFFVRSGEVNLYSYSLKSVFKLKTYQQKKEICGRSTKTQEVEVDTFHPLMCHQTAIRRNSASYRNHHNNVRNPQKTAEIRSHQFVQDTKKRRVNIVWDYLKHVIDWFLLPLAASPSQWMVITMATTWWRFVQINKFVLLWTRTHTHSHLIQGI